MSRRRRPEKREILPDPKFGDITLSKFMNSVMLDGKKSVAEGIVYGAFETVESRAKRDPIDPVQQGSKVHGQAAARRYAKRLDRALDMLRAFPHLAPLLDWVEPPVHFLRVGQHHLLYDVIDDVVWVNRILHVARDLSNWPSA